MVLENQQFFIMVAKCKDGQTLIPHLGICLFFQKNPLRLFFFYLHIWNNNKS